MRWKTAGLELSQVEVDVLSMTAGAARVWLARDWTVEQETLMLVIHPADVGFPSEPKIEYLSRTVWGRHSAYDEERHPATMGMTFCGSTSCKCEADTDREIPGDYWANTRAMYMEM